MTFAQLVVVIVVVVPLVLMILNRLRMDVAALMMAVVLGTAQFFGLGVLGPANHPADALKAITGLSQPVVVTLLGLFIITRSMEKSGIARWIARKLLKLGGQSVGRLIFLFSGTTAFLSLFMNNLAAGALILPSAMEAARKTGIKPSKLLIPVSFGSLLGGVATYFTTANIIVSDLLTIAQPPQAPLDILDFTPTGGLIAIAGIVFLGVLGNRLLPDRIPSAEHIIVRPTGSELEDIYQLGDRLWEARVQADSAFVGKTLYQAAIGERLGVTVVAIYHHEQVVFAPPPDKVIQGGDKLILVGREDRVLQLKDTGLVVDHEVMHDHISSQGVMMVEVMLAPHSAIEGRTLKEIDFRRKYRLTAVALLRKNRSYRTNVGDFALEPGDTILVFGARSNLQILQKSPDFLVLEPSLSDQPIEKREAALSIGVVATAIMISILGFPVYLAMLGGAVFLVLTRCLTMEEAYRSIEWQAIFLITGMYSVSVAMVQTGLAAQLGNFMVSVTTPLGPLGLAIGAYTLSSILTQVMGGQVTAMVTGPVAISAAIGMHVSPQAVAVATAIGCSTSFFTPFAHPLNILIIAPGNYQFGDFFRVGWRLTVICLAMLILGMMLFWGL